MNLTELIGDVGDVERKNSSDEHILIALVTQSYYAASDPWPLAFDPLAHIKEEIQGKNSHNRPDCSNTINYVGDGRAVEYYFASDARWDTISRFGLRWICMGHTIKIFLSLHKCHSKVREKKNTS